MNTKKTRLFFAPRNEYCQFLFHRTVAVFILILIALSSSGQSVFEQMSKVPSLTPQAAAFSKYVEFPVSYYNGIPDISVPLYTISAGDLSIPISLSYHAGGIKVAEEASWVGLGWNLSVGGVISRQVMGADDFASIDTHYGKIRPLATNPFDEAVTNKANFPLCNAWDVNGNLITTSMSQEILTNIPNTDGEPDIYMYNFGPYSGKFIYPDMCVDVGKSNIQFSVSSTGITARTPDGALYEFGYVEKGWVGTNPQSPTAFYLTKITSPKGKVINFTYVALANVRQLPSFSEQFVSKYGPVGSGSSDSYGPLTWNRSYTTTNPVFLESISWDHGTVTFVKSTRQDMTGRKLDEIVVKRTDGSVVNRFRFDYDYFVAAMSRHYEESGYPQSPIPELAYPEDYLKKRLKLLWVQEEGDGSGASSDYKRHSFEYYEGGNLSLPYKSSYATDFWGFYNGNMANEHLIPSVASVSNDAGIHPTISNFLGANKRPNGNFITACMLKKVTYPTKGSTRYQYEIHQYTNNYDASPQYVTVELANVLDTGTGVKEQTFTGSAFKLTVALYCGCADNLCHCTGSSSTPWTCGDFSNSGYQPNVMYAQLLKLNTATGQFNPVSLEYTWDVHDIMPCGGQNSTGNFQKDVNLPYGTYKLLVNYPDNETGSPGSKMAFMRAYRIEPYYEPAPTGGGVRVSQITHEDVDNNVNLSRTFTYADGLLMHFPRFFWRKPELQIADPNAGVVNHILMRAEHLFSNAATPYSSSANGSAVGYGRVTEIMTGGQNGRIEYLYDNAVDYFNEMNINTDAPLYDFHAFAPGIGAVARQKNGFLKEKIVYNNNGSIVSKSVSVPAFVAESPYWGIKKERLVQPGAYFYQNFCSSEYAQVMYYFYPIHLSKVVPSSTTEIQYEGGVATTTVTKSFAYNNLGLTTTETTTSSDNKTIQTEFKYAKDYTNAGWLTDLYSKNIVTTPLETMTKVNGSVVGGSFLKYKTANGLTLPNEVYQIETTQPTSVTSTAPSGTIASPHFKLQGKMEYDAAGNLVEKQMANNIKISYLWGYNSILPVAEITNATAGEVFYTSFEDATSNSSLISKTGRKGLTGAFTVPLPTSGAGSYTLTYWLHNGSTWQYIEETMTAPKVIGGAGMVVDEVRVHPPGARMTTFAYDPLKGLTEAADANGNVTYYEYDAFSRLRLVRDSDGNIVNHYTYHYR